MMIGRAKHEVILAAVAALALLASSTCAPASETPTCAPQDNVAAASEHASVLEQARRDCPMLAAIIEDFVLLDLGEVFPGEAFPGNGAKPRASEIARLTAAAASEESDAMRRLAEMAREAGATTLELKKMLYLTAVKGGVPKAIEATRALADLLMQEDQSRPAQPVAPMKSM